MVCYTTRRIYVSVFDLLQAIVMPSSFQDLPWSVLSAGPEPQLYHLLSEISPPLYFTAHQYIHHTCRYSPSPIISHLITSMVLPPAVTPQIHHQQRTRSHRLVKRVSKMTDSIKHPLLKMNNIQPPAMVNTHSTVMLYFTHGF